MIRETVPKVTNLLEMGLEYKINYEGMDAANSFHNPHAGVSFVLYIIHVVCILQKILHFSHFNLYSLALWRFNQMEHV